MNEQSKSLLNILQAAKEHIYNSAFLPKSSRLLVPTKELTKQDKLIKQKLITIFSYILIIGFFYLLCLLIAYLSDQIVVSVIKIINASTIFASEHFTFVLSVILFLIFIWIFYTKVLSKNNKAMRYLEFHSRTKTFLNQINLLEEKIKNNQKVTISSLEDLEVNFGLYIIAFQKGISFVLKNKYLANIFLIDGKKNYEYWQKQTNGLLKIKQEIHELKTKI